MKKWRVNGDKVFYSLGDAFRSLFPLPIGRPTEDDCHRLERKAWEAGKLRVGGLDANDRTYYIDYGEFTL